MKDCDIEQVGQRNVPIEDFKSNAFRKKWTAKPKIITSITQIGTLLAICIKRRGSLKKTNTTNRMTKDVTANAFRALRISEVQYSKYVF